MLGFFRRPRRFTVLEQTFALPTLRLRPLLRRAERSRRHLEPRGLDAALDRFRTEERKTERAYRRAHVVLDAHDAVIFAALAHVGAYDDALARATRHVAERARDKLDRLSDQAAHRRRFAQTGAHLGARAEASLARDLQIVARHMQVVARSAATCLGRLGRYRDFVAGCADAVVERQEALRLKRDELLHEEQTWRWRRKMEGDHEISGWIRGADALCGQIEDALHAMRRDLDGLERRIDEVPLLFDRLIEGDLDAAPDLEAQLPAFDLPTVSDLPVRLGDADWAAIQVDDLREARLFDEASLDEVRERASAWVDAAARLAAGDRVAPPCAHCAAPITNGAVRGRAHYLCVTCRDGDLDLGDVDDPSARAERAGGLLVQKTPVTRLQFELIMGWTPERTPDVPASAPVTRVSWLEAVAFCNALSELDGLRPAYRIRGRRVRWAGPDAEGWRLPSAAEWQTLCVADQPGWWRALDRVAWHAGNAGGRPRPVAKRRPNPWGLHDMLGNAAEWLWDDGGPPARRGGPRRELQGDERLVAGGGFLAEADQIAPDKTLALLVEARDPGVGFRVVRRIPAPATSKSTAQRPRAKRPRARRGRLCPARTWALVCYALLVFGAVALIILDRAGAFDGPSEQRSAPAGPAAAAPLEVPTPEAPRPHADDTTAAAGPGGGVEGLAAPRPTPTERAEADRRHADGVRARLEGRRGVGIRHFRAALEADPTHVGAAYDLARSLARQGRRDEALNLLEDLAARAAAGDLDAAAALERAGTEADLRRVRGERRWRAIAP